MKTCKDCKKNLCEPNRRICHECHLARIRNKYKEKGGSKFLIRYGNGKCKNCGCIIKLNRKEQKYCLKCSRIINSFGKTPNSYQIAGGGGYSWLHRRLAEDILKRKLSTNEVVHHVDHNSKNNNLKNLIIISRIYHGRLHWFLKEQRAILEKSSNENWENCWKTLIVPITTAWLETAGVKVIKLWEIGQSASDPLKEKSHEAGSETMHPTPILR
jgi:hypothetical protein